MEQNMKYMAKLIYQMHQTKTIFIRLYIAHGDCSADTLQTKNDNAGNFKPRVFYQKSEISGLKKKRYPFVHGTFDNE